MELVLASLVATLVGFGVSRAFPGRDAVSAERLTRLSIARAPSQESERPLLVSIGQKLPGNRDRIARDLERAGMGEWNVESFLAARYLAAVAGVVLGLLTGPLALIAVPLLGAVGYRLPDLVSKSRARGRREELARDLPDAVDLLAVCTQAGLNVALALERVAQGAPGPLGEELRRTVRQIRLGESRESALSDLVQRVEQDDLRSLAGILVGAERFGTKVATALENFAEELRTRRRRRAEERARKAPIKMLFPLVFLILPGFILLTLVPLLLGTFRSLGF